MRCFVAISEPVSGWLPSAVRIVPSVSSWWRLGEWSLRRCSVALGLSTFRHGCRRGASLFYDAVMLVMNPFLFHFSSRGDSFSYLRPATDECSEPPMTLFSSSSWVRQLLVLEFAAVVVVVVTLFLSFPSCFRCLTFSTKKKTRCGFGDRGKPCRSSTSVQ